MSPALFAYRRGRSVVSTRLGSVIRAASAGLWYRALRIPGRGVIMFEGRVVAAVIMRGMSYSVRHRKLGFGVKVATPHPALRQGGRVLISPPLAGGGRGKLTAWRKRLFQCS